MYITLVYLDCPYRDPQFDKWVTFFERLIASGYWTKHLPRIGSTTSRDEDRIGFVTGSGDGVIDNAKLEKL